MKRNKLGQFNQELKDPVLLTAQVERYDHKWLKSEARKKKLSAAGFIRHLIHQAKKILK